MTPDELRQRVAVIGAEDAVGELIDVQTVAACRDGASYSEFCRLVSLECPGSQKIFIAGSGNWGFSLNPKNKLRLFGDHSDIDVGVIHESYFHTTWEELRKYHREAYYRIGRLSQDWLRRNGENVYSGFVSPAWIPDKSNGFRFQHTKRLNQLRSQLVGFKEVKMMFFKSRIEAVDYYKRGLISL